MAEIVVDRRGNEIKRKPWSPQRQVQQSRIEQLEAEERRQRRQTGRQTPKQVQSKDGPLQAQRNPAKQQQDDQLQAQTKQAKQQQDGQLQAQMKAKQQDGLQKQVLVEKPKWREQWEKWEEDRKQRQPAGVHAPPAPPYEAHPPPGHVSITSAHQVDSICPNDVIVLTQRDCCKHCGGSLHEVTPTLAIALGICLGLIFWPLCFLMRIKEKQCK